MEVQFLGACGEVGRSAILVTCGKKILMDAGIKLGQSEDQFPLIDGELARSLDMVIITHAHLDHCGFLPHLVSLGFNGKIYSTKPTRDLCQLLLADYARISREENRKEFSAEDVIKALTLFEYLDYWKKKKIDDDTYVTLYKAGHILGASMIRLEHKGKSLLYTGDLSLRESNLLDKADTDIEPFDTLIMESTYADSEIPSLKNSSKKLADIIRDTTVRGGKIIIPAFGVGRSQEMMVIIDNYIKSGGITKIPCYLDGMILKANRVYRHNVLYLKEEIPRRILLAEDDPFQSQNFSSPKSKDRSDVLSEKAAVIITTSGMLTGGPVLKYMKKLAGDANNTLVLVGYQSEGTLGRELADGAKEITLDNAPLAISMKVEQINFSAHADRQQLLEFVNITKPKKVYLVHGDIEKMEKLAKEIRNCELAKLGETVKV